MRGLRAEAGSNRQGIRTYLGLMRGDGSVTVRPLKVGKLLARFRVFVHTHRTHQRHRREAAAVEAPVDVPLATHTVVAIDNMDLQRAGFGRNNLLNNTRDGLHVIYRVAVVYRFKASYRRVMGGRSRTPETGGSGMKVAGVEGVGDGGDSGGGGGGGADGGDGGRDVGDRGEGGDRGDGGDVGGDGGGLDNMLLDGQRGQDVSVVEQTHDPGPSTSAPDPSSSTGEQQNAAAGQPGATGAHAPQGEGAEADTGVRTRARTGKAKPSSTVPWKHRDSPTSAPGLPVPPTPSPAPPPPPARTPAQQPPAPSAPPSSGTKDALPSNAPAAPPEVQITTRLGASIAVSPAAYARARSLFDQPAQAKDFFGLHAVADIERQLETHLLAAHTVDSQVDVQEVYSLIAKLYPAIEVEAVSITVHELPPTNASPSSNSGVLQALVESERDLNVIGADGEVRFYVLVVADQAIHVRIQKLKRKYPRMLRWVVPCPGELGCRQVDLAVTTPCVCCCRS